MKRTPRLVVSLVSLLSLAVGSTRAAEPDFAKLFEGRDGCFELYDLTADKLVVRFNPDRCAQRASPCSTFKVPLALMAFDAGILKDETSSMKWDGTKYSRDAWNRDQTAATWMRDSVVWFSQRLTPQLGMDKVKDYLARFDFGNRDMSGGLTKAWLESSLQISPDEALRFWERFWREQLPVSKHAFEMTKTITLVDTSPAGWTLHGKTGSGDIPSPGSGKDSGLRLGWYVGHVARGGRSYVFVSSYSDRVPSADSNPSGWIARGIALKILQQMGLY
jgi:beta-lactamase class D